MLCIKVMRAYGLPDMLGGTNPYILFDWGHLGRASTHAVQNTTSPEFNATLRFKSPSEHGSSLSTTLMNSPPLSISVYSRNESLSDVVIGGIQLDDKDMNSNYPLRVYLYSQDPDGGEDQIECGVLEFQVYVI
jgi:Ca2+-dependent lipid-binding protein